MKLQEKEETPHHQPNPTRLYRCVKAVSILVKNKTEAAALSKTRQY